MIDRFRRRSFDSVEFFIESVERPKIKFGGSSSSTILNRYFDSLSQDVALLLTRTNVLAERGERLELGMIAQDGALNAAFQSLSSRVDAVSGLSEVLADLHSGFYLDQGQTTASVNYIFGQATLPIAGATDLLVQTDVYGRAVVSPEVELSWATGNNPGGDDFIPSPEGIAMLSEEQTLILPSLNGVGWIKLKAPMQFRGLVPNVLDVWPFPAFGMDIEEVAYRVAGESFTGTWQTLDLSYLPGYSGGKVVMAGPVRLHLPGVPLSQIRIKIRTRSLTPWGLHRLKVYSTQYASSGILTVRDPYSRTIGQLIIRGKDPSELSLLTVTKVGNTAGIHLTTTDSSKSPVITGVIYRV